MAIEHDASGGSELQPIMAVVDRVITSVEPGVPVTGNARITLTGRDGRLVDGGALVPAEPRG